MTLALLDCPTGLAGDMLLAALFDLGLPEAVVHEPLAALGLQGRYRLGIEEGRSGGLRGRRLRVESLEEEPHHRPWGDLRERLGGAPLAPALRQRVLSVFTLLAEAEAAVHGHTPDEVHFHEVGA
ncbi:MAG: nickel insertion protein, partial [Synechococcaceae cyanobacterium]